MLKSHISNNTRCEIESQTWFERAVQEIPNIDTIGFSDEDDTWSGW